MSLLERRVLLLPNQDTPTPFFASTAHGIIESITMMLTTSADPGNRQYALRWLSKVGVQKAVLPTASIGPSLTVLLTFSVGMSYNSLLNAVSGAVVSGMPLMAIEQGDTIIMEDLAGISTLDRMTDICGVFRLAV